MQRWMVLWIAMACMITGGLTQGAHAGQNKPVVIKFATLLPKENAPLFVQLQKDIKKETRNAVELKIYYGGVQGDELDVLRKIRLRQIHGGSFTGHGLGKIVPEVRVTELPYLFRNYGEVSYVRGNLNSNMTDLFDKQGYVVLGWYDTGFVYVFSKVPIATVEVAREQKWWMWEGDPMQKANFDAMGISPVPLSLTDVLTSLSTRLIDAAATTPFGAVVFRWYDRFHYMGEYPVANGIVGMIVTREVWNKVSAENQEKIIRLTQTLASKMIEETRTSNEQSIEVLKKAGIAVVPYDMESEGMKFILGAAKKARKNLINELYTEELLNQTLALVDTYRQKHPDSDVVKIR